MTVNATAALSTIGKSGAAVLLTGALWIFLVGADAQAWPIALPAIAIAAGCTMALPPGGPESFRVVPCLRLIGCFLRDSIRGALDVGLRGIAPRVSNRSGVFRWQTSLRSSFSRLILAHAISLVPGTLSARVDGADLLVHVLDHCGPWREELKALEARVSATFESAAQASS